LKRSLALGAILSLVGASTAVVSPRENVAVAAPDIAALLPSEFGVWRETRLADVVLPPERELNPGEAVAFKAYRDDFGRLITLVVAYGPSSGDSVRLHQPETCYTAQGFLVSDKSVSEIQVGAASLPSVRLETTGPTRRESVTYLLRFGERFVTRAADAQFAAFVRRRGYARDGALIRVSTIEAGAPQFALHQEFLTAFIDALEPGTRRVLLGVQL
jgi:EpsI family protein